MSHTQFQLNGIMNNLFGNLRGDAMQVPERLRRQLALISSEYQEMALASLALSWLLDFRNRDVGLNAGKNVEGFDCLAYVEEKFLKEIDMDNPPTTLTGQVLAEHIDELIELVCIEVRDGVADVIVTCDGLAWRLGADRDADLDEVIRSNFSKFCETQEQAEASARHYEDELRVPVNIIYDDDTGIRSIVSSEDTTGQDGIFYPKGKILKPLHYSRPKLGPVPETLSLPKFTGLQESV